MQYYYEIEEAWKLYVGQGVVKAESLNPSLLRMWEISKISGADYARDKLSLAPNPNYTSKLSLNLSFDSLAHEHSLLILLLDSNNCIEDSCGKAFDNLSLGLGARLSQDITGYTALSLSRETNQIEGLNYAENYIKAFHDYETLSLPLSINGKRYFIYVLSDRPHLRERVLDTLKFLSLQLVEKERELENSQNYKIKDFTVLFEVDLKGKITNRLTNTEYNKYFENNMKLKENFNLYDLDDMLRGIRQIIINKKEIELKFLLSPIKWISSSSILCQAEELEESYRPFYDIEKSYQNKLDCGQISREVDRRLASLTSSKYASIITFGNKLELVEVMGMISNYDNRENLVLDYSKNADLVRELCYEPRVRRMIQPHDYRDVIYHILAADLEDASQRHNLGREILAALKIGIKPYKLVFYLKREEMNTLNLHKESSLIELQSMDIAKLRLSTSLNKSNNADQTYGQRSGLSDILRADCFSEEEGSKEQPYPDMELDANKKGLELRSASKKTKSLNQTVGERTSYSIKDREKETIIEALLASSYNVSEACKILEISRATIYRKMREYNIKIRK